MPADFRERMQKLFGQPTFLGQRVQDRLKGSGPTGSGRIQDRWKPDVVTETQPTRTKTSIFFAGTQQGNPTRSRDGES
jgi:hypothetical protein